jgi:hypothetical protein
VSINRLIAIPIVKLLVGKRLSYKLTSLEQHLEQINSLYKQTTTGLFLFVRALELPTLTFECSDPKEAETVDANNCYSN